MRRAALPLALALLLVAAPARPVDDGPAWEAFRAARDAYRATIADPRSGEGARDAARAAMERAQRDLFEARRPADPFARRGMPASPFGRVPVRMETAFTPPVGIPAPPVAPPRPVFFDPWRADTLETAPR